MVIRNMALAIQIVLDQMLEKRKMTRYELAKRSNTAYPTLDKYYKNKVIRYDKNILLKICTVLDCEPGDIIRLVDDGKDA